MKPLDKVKIVKSSKPEYIGFEGVLYTNLQSFHVNAGIFPILEVLNIDKDRNCIGIIGDKGSFWWTKNSDFDIEISII